MGLDLVGKRAAEEAPGGCIPSHLQQEDAAGACHTEFGIIRCLTNLMLVHDGSWHQPLGIPDGNIFNAIDRYELEQHGNKVGGSRVRAQMTYWGLGLASGLDAE